MGKPPHTELSRRERQIMDVVYRRGRASVAEIQAEVPDDASYSAIRSALRLLREKDVIRYEHDGKKYVYLPAVSADEARRSALDHVVSTFFEGSHARTVGALLELSDLDLSEAEIERLEALIAEARTKGNER